jgi:hypothetical protein
MKSMPWENSRNYKDAWIKTRRHVNLIGLPKRSKQAVSV